MWDVYTFAGWVVCLHDADCLVPLDLLGERLECEDEGRYRDNANLCYICSGNVDKFVECWNKTARGSQVSAVALQDLMEKVVLLKRAVERERKQLTSTTSSVVAEKFRLWMYNLRVWNRDGTRRGRHRIPTVPIPFQTLVLPRQLSPIHTNGLNQPSVPTPTPITAPVMTPLGEAPIAGQQAPPMSGATATYRQSSPAPAPTQPPAPQVIEKAPLPPEHQQMAHKRKTEDISRKLATLCDLLRESRISPDVLMGLHYIAQEAAAVNYTAGLSRYTQMVSSGNFSEISQLHARNQGPAPDGHAATEGPKLVKTLGMIH
ncbi:Protein transport protein Sec31A [Geodia barretti]|uniref:Protein transport protein Sec31A n=1 Tax=Geodia barretti TaxID=519541 RepID=A0AA35TIL8_GEOBA|nr:Protein transport protein Sec31A [Geodia barretti]